jgi:hypothetical protein
MSDRELLELAAKAGGIEYDGIDDNGCRIGFWGDGWGGGYKYWNSLQSDGDALRLAARLNIDIVWEAHGPEFDLVTHVWCSSRMQALGAVESVDVQGDAALRRAITRAAAEIGRGMG